MKTLDCNVSQGISGGFVLLSFILLAVIRPASVGAEAVLGGDTSRKEKIHISSDSLVVNDTERYAEFIGHVKAVQGTTQIVSDRLKIYYEGNRQEPSEDTEKRDSIKKIVATGNVIINFDDTVAESREAVYTTSNRILVLTGPHAKVTKASSGTISGAKISINRESGQIKFEGNVEGLFFPGEKGLN